MRQTLHIFRKDVRHCWPYIAAVLALTAMYAWMEPTGHLAASTNIGAIVPPLLLELSWWLAIGAAVHGESIVGDRQFWVTRPYSWKSLLAAKWLFVAAFLAVPLAISDCYILYASGFSPLGQIPHLLWRQCWFLFFLVLPFVAAALTRLMRELFFAGLLFWAVCFLSARLIGLLLHHAFPEWFRAAVPWLLFAVGFLLIVWQYASRRADLTRTIVLGLCLAAFLCMWPAFFGKAVTESPFAAGDDPRFRNVAVQFAPDPGLPNPVDAGSRTKGLIGIPVTLTGWPPNMMTCQLAEAYLMVHGVPVLIWNGHVDLDAATRSDGRAVATFVIREFTRETLAEQPADLRLAFDLNLYETKASVTLSPEGTWTNIPGFGAVGLRKMSAKSCRLIWRTPLKAEVSGWTYRLGRPGAESDGAWLNYGNEPLTPLLFKISPVNSNLGVEVTGTVGFTAKDFVTISRELNIPQIRLVDYETRLP
jgi:hypothetical protein